VRPDTRIPTVRRGRDIGALPPPRAADATLARMSQGSAKLRSRGCFPCHDLVLLLVSSIRHGTKITPLAPDAKVIAIKGLGLTPSPSLYGRSPLGKRSKYGPRRHCGKRM